MKKVPFRLESDYAFMPGRMKKARRVGAPSTAAESSSAAPMPTSRILPRAASPLPKSLAQYEPSETGTLAKFATRI